MSGDSSVNVYNTGNVTSTEESNVDVEWGKYVANGGRFYIELTIKSKDGSPIIPNDDTLSPIIGTFDFADTVIKISDETNQQVHYTILIIMVCQMMVQKYMQN